MRLFTSVRHRLNRPVSPSLLGDAAGDATWGTTRTQRSGGRPRPTARPIRIQQARFKIHISTHSKRFQVVSASEQTRRDGEKSEGIMGRNHRLNKQDQSRQNKEQRRRSLPLPTSLRAGERSGTAPPHQTHIRETAHTQMVRKRHTGERVREGGREGEMERGREG